MKYFDKDFWKMASGFLVIIALALISIYILQYIRIL